MAWTIPDKGEGVNDLQSILFQEYLDILVRGISGTHCVLFGCDVTGGADMTPAVALGAVLVNGIMFPVTAGDVTVTAADATNPRLDMIVVDNTGTKVVRAGTPAANPKPPVLSGADVAIAVVYVPAGATTIPTANITDMRVLITQGPIRIYKTVGPETTNTTAAAIEALNKPGAGVTIPAGLMTSAAGFKKLRVRLGGNMLLNSGTPTVRIAILFGGTVMFSDISGASVNDADRLAWFIDFEISAQGTSDQALSGRISVSSLAAKTAPTTGIGDIWATVNNEGAISGAAAVNSGSANRLLSVQFTFSVANAANELVVEQASVELL